jgi:hypothetical protein
MGNSQYEQGARNYVQTWDEYQRIRRCGQAAKARMKRFHDNKLTRMHLYEVGQLVWFNVKNVGLRHESMPHKLIPKYWGPFKILELGGKNAVRLDLSCKFNASTSCGVCGIDQTVSASTKSATFSCYN